MKVLHLITKSNWGGAQRCVFDLAQDTRGAGIDVAVALGGDGPLAARLRDVGIRVIPIPSLGRDIAARGDLAAARDIWRILGEERPDVLHLHSSKAGGIGALLGRLRRIPAIVFTAHGWAFNESRPEWQRLLIRALHVATVLLAHRTIAVAAAIPRQLGWGSILGRRFTVIRNGTDFGEPLGREAARAALAESKPELAAALAASGDAPAIVAVAELHRIKGLDTLIEATADLSRRNPELDFSVSILGEGEARADLERLIAERDQGDRVRLAGFTRDASRLLPAFDIFAMPSRSEALPLALIEAGAAGLPCIASRVGGIPEVIANQETGLLVSPERPRELAEALRRLIEDAPLRARFGASLRERVRAEFSRERMSTATVALYRRLTGL
jgi:glycosyltransferase involved in cell wall biosynthesis